MLQVGALQALARSRTENHWVNGQNIGAHFDLTRTTDRPTAEAMLDLIDYLIEYLYTLPGMIEELNRRVQQLDQQSDGNEPEAEA